MTATQWLEEYDYVGTPTSDTQALKWPVVSIFDTKGKLVADSSGTPALILGKYDDATMPVPLLNATCELAFYLLTLGAAAGSAALTTGLGTVSSLKLGQEVQVTYQQQTGSATAVVAPTTDTTGLPIHVARLLRGLRLPVVIA